MKQLRSTHPVSSFPVVKRASLTKQAKKFCPVHLEKSLGRPHMDFSLLNVIEA